MYCASETVSGLSGDSPIEDLFEPAYYLDKVAQAYKKQLASASIERPTLDGQGQLVKQVERACHALGFNFNKGSVAKLIRTELANLKTADDLPVKSETLPLMSLRISDSFSGEGGGPKPAATKKNARTKKTKMTTGPGANTDSQDQP